VPFIVASALAAWFGMNDIADAKAGVRRAGGDLHAQAQLADVLAVPGHLRQLHRLRRRLSAADQVQFPAVDALPTPGSARWSGAVIRPFGGWLADKLGGARVTFWNFVAMALAVLAVLAFLPKAPRAAGRQLRGFLACCSCCCSPPPASATARPSA
jgi:MFS transporter, NNP family, nitrate/nitrite transporter